MKKVEYDIEFESSHTFLRVVCANGKNSINVNIHSSSTHKHSLTGPNHLQLLPSDTQHPIRDTDPSYETCLRDMRGSPIH